MTRRRRRPAPETRRRLVDSAREVLVEGAGALEVAEVARRIDVSESLAYYHFRNKAGLLAAVIHDFYERLDDAVVAVPFPGATWVERERARVRATIDFMYADPAAALVVNVVAAEPSLLEHQRERQRRLNLLGARNIAQAQRAGEVPAELDSHLLVSMILGGVFAGISEALAAVPRRPRDEIEREIWSFVARAAGVAPVV